MEKKSCKHEFKPVRWNVQEAITTHYDYQDHHLTTLSHEKVKLFCIHCGKTKEIK